MIMFASLAWSDDFGQRQAADSVEGDQGMGEDAAEAVDQQRSVVDDQRLCAVCQQPYQSEWVGPSNWR